MVTRKQNIFLMRGQTSLGIDCYYYVQIDPTKVELFARVEERSRVNIDDWGKVLMKGYGEPTAAVKLKMHEQYGFVTDENENN